jgi:hypothetical protein
VEIIIALLLVLGSVAQSGATTPPDAANAIFLAALEPEIGRFAVTNWVKKGPGQSEEHQLVAETSVVLAGTGLRTQWHDAQTGTYVGELTRCLDPQTGEVVQLWYAARSGLWTMTRQVRELEPTGHRTTFSGEDGFGAFEARAHTAYRHDGGFEWTIERRYAGTDWFMVDHGVARPIK